jgi:hypothetical protein
MKYVIAYGLVVLLARFFFWLGSVVVGFPVAGCLAKASDQIRGIIAGILSGLAGTAASVAFCYLLFRQLFNESAFGMWPLLAATAPLLITIRKDLFLSGVLSEDDAKLRALRSETADNLGGRAMAIGLKFKSVGGLIGIALAFLCLIFK